jgi:hypothetical protein
MFQFVRVQAAGAPGVTAAVPAEVGGFGCYVNVLPSICSLNSQAVSATVSVEAVLDTLGSLNLTAHVDRVATHLGDNGFEDQVPLGSLVQLLCDAGVPPSRSVAVKNAVVRNLASPVRCTRAV